ncbi:Sugar transport protein 5 [Rhynchospora pubera]|uniref:Sugar transport protein 5 n=1 Tax=Rhynchospora pubera TaxID=906938 RepID=A0AAV8DDV4_9POAL|nr:Sugar transport protein 5 [Rhynchospora pubera]
MPRFSEGADHGGSLTWSVMVTCIMAASGGLIFGYDIGISGGVTAMESFLKQFFPHVLKKMAEAQQNEYCMYDDHSLTAFTSSLYIAALAASLAASKVTELIGRQKVMLLGGFLFFAGSATNAAASNITMLIIGRMFLGFGVGFTNQATPVYLAETSPARYRGAFTTAFQFFNGIGVLAANLTNYFASHIPGWGWRLSLGLAAVPAVFIVLGALLITDTPSSLILRGRIDSARAALKQIRGADSDVDSEMKEMMYSVEQAQINNEGAFKRLLRREYRPHLVMALAIPSFMQLTGVIVIAFFAPLLFRTIGFGSDGALIGAVLLGSVNLTSILVSTFTVDRYGRKVLFMIGGIQMIVCQVLCSRIWMVMGPAKLDHFRRDFTGRDTVSSAGPRPGKAHSSQVTPAVTLTNYPGSRTTSTNHQVQTTVGTSTSTAVNLSDPWLPRSNKTGMEDASLNDANGTHREDDISADMSDNDDSSNSK